MCSLLTLVKRNVLAARCEYFRLMFGSEMGEKQAERIELPEIDSEVFEMIVNFVYTAVLPKVA